MRPCEFLFLYRSLSGPAITELGEELILTKQYIDKKWDDGVTTYIARTALIPDANIDFERFPLTISMDVTSYIREGDIEVLGNMNNFARIQLTYKGLFRVKEYLLRNVGSVEESIINALTGDNISRTIDEELKSSPDKLHYLLNTKNVRARPWEEYAAIPKGG